jgi:hypothetical protein
MKYCLIALILLVPLAAQAAAPEESYFAARDGYIQKVQVCRHERQDRRPHAQ